MVTAISGAAYYPPPFGRRQTTAVVVENNRSCIGLPYIGALIRFHHRRGPSPYLIDDRRYRRVDHLHLEGE